MRPIVELPAVERAVIDIVGSGVMLTSAILRERTGCTQHMASRVLASWIKSGILERKIRIPDKRGGFWHEYYAGPHFADAKISELYQAKASDLEIKYRELQKQAGAKATFMSSHMNMMKKLRVINPKLAMMWLEEASKLRGASGSLVVANSIDTSAILYPIWSTAAGFNDNAVEFLREAPDKWGLFLVRGDIHAAIRI